MLGSDRIGSADSLEAANHGRSTCEERQYAKGKIDTLIQAIDRLSDQMEDLIDAADNQRHGGGRKDASSEAAWIAHASAMYRSAEIR